ncbi:30S ribosomal protein S6 [Mycoplasmoides alvi]|uniref:30S ribosomal protein S6 n=1 Tax=Mycoplasmoides alvi TaxID=78580 RepID=UPI0006981C2C|nr:30S ribosomal protein S6 [Mycoplasmoides alvi]
MISKYEIMVIVSGKLDTAKSDKIVEDLNKNIESQNLNVKFLGTKELAYPINNETLGHYYQINFDGEGNSFVDWRRLVLINKFVLRHLIINLSKDYGWRASNNEKKLKISAIQKAKYDEIINNPDYIHPKQNHQVVFKKKKRDEWTLIRRVGANGLEDITIKNPKHRKNKYSELPEYRINSKKQIKNEENLNSLNEKNVSSNENIEVIDNNKVILENDLKITKIQEKSFEKTKVLVEENNQLINSIGDEKTTIIAKEQEGTLVKETTNASNGLFPQDTYEDENTLVSEITETKNNPVEIIVEERTTKNLFNDDYHKDENDKKSKIKHNNVRRKEKIVSSDVKEDFDDYFENDENSQKMTEKSSLRKSKIKNVIDSDIDKKNNQAHNHKPHRHIIEHFKDKELLELKKNKKTTTKPKTSIKKTINPTKPKKEVTSKQIIENDGTNVKKVNLKPVSSKSKSTKTVSNSKKTINKKGNK